MLVLRISKYNEENNVIAQTPPLVTLVFREEARKTPELPNSIGAISQLCIKKHVYRKCPKKYMLMCYQ
jgi:hypothetical protein